MCRSPPDFHPDSDITISMDISPNPSPQQWNDSLRVLYLNTRSLKAIVDSPDDCARKICKISLLQQLVYGEDFHVISLCETWLNSTVLDCRDRDSRGGGVLIAVKNTIHASRRIDLERVGTELVVVELRNGHDKPFCSTASIILTIRHYWS